MRIMSILSGAAFALVSGAACAESVKITNIGHGYFSAALYIAKQEKILPGARDFLRAGWRARSTGNAHQAGRRRYPQL